MTLRFQGNNVRTLAEWRLAGGNEDPIMATSRVYLDYNASAPLLPAARAAMLAAIDADANPSSVHSEGRAARRIVEDARRAVAGLVNAKPDHVVFTSGATEAAATLLSPAYRMGRGSLRMGRLFVSASDHPCILGGGRFPADAVTRLGVDGNGILDLEALRRELAAHHRDRGLPLVAMHWANNETGVVQPVREIAAIVKAAGGTLVLDAAQVGGRIPIDISAGWVDYVILSSHKMGGPTGAGAMVAASDLVMPEPLISGGGQEKGHRGGTENLPAIAGFGAAAREAAAQLAGADRLRAMRDAIEDTVTHLAPDAIFFGRDAERLPNTSFFAIPGMKAETAQIGFDLAGVALSAGSACSSGKVGPSHVLNAMGHDAHPGALRVSIGHATTEAEIAKFAKALERIVARRKERSEAA